jgi:hypothetical protein
MLRNFSAVKMARISADRFLHGSCNLFIISSKNFSIVNSRAALSLSVAHAPATKANNQHWVRLTLSTSEIDFALVHKCRLQLEMICSGTFEQVVQPVFGGAGE